MHGIWYLNSITHQWMSCHDWTLWGPWTPRSERCGGAGRLLLAQIDLWKPTTGWVVGRFSWTREGGVADPEWRGCQGRNEMTTRFWIPPNGLKVGEAPQMGVLTILDNPHIFTLVFVKCVGTRESCPVSSVAWFYLWGPEPVQGPWPWQWCLSINVHVEFAIVSVNSDLLFCVFWRL